MVIIPKKSDINPGDYVFITNNSNMIEMIKKEENNGTRQKIRY